MGPDLVIKALINTSLEEVLGWKCCSLPGMNFEVQVTNRGDEAVAVRSEMELAGEGGSERVGYFYPAGVHRIGPGDGLAFYCSFAEDRFHIFSHIIVEDGEGRKYRAALSGREEAAEAV